MRDIASTCLLCMQLCELSYRLNKEIIPAARGALRIDLVKKLYDVDELCKEQTKLMELALDKVNLATNTLESYVE